MKEILSATAASKLIGCSPQKMRIRIQRGIWHFGTYVPAEKAGGKADYIIYARKMYKELGIPFPEEGVKNE